MAHRGTECANAVRDVAREAGAEVEIRQARKHQIAVLKYAGKVRKQFLSCTPSDRNGWKSAARQARRTLAEMGALR